MDGPDGDRGHPSQMGGIGGVAIWLMQRTMRPLACAQNQGLT